MEKERSSATSKDHFFSACDRGGAPRHRSDGISSARYPVPEKPYTSTCSPCAPEPNCSRKSPQKLMISTGVSAIPTICAETQTTPRSSCEDSLVSVSQTRRDSSISMHRVTVIDGSTETYDPSPPSSRATRLTNSNHLQSVDSQSTDPVSNEIVTNRRVEKIKTPDLHHSPTTTVVKQVIGAKLFDTAVEQSTPGRTDRSSDGYFDTLSEHSSLSVHKSQTKHDSENDEEDQQQSAPSISSPFPDYPDSHNSSEITKPGATSSSDVDDPQEILDALLESIRNETGEFADDPVLISLRQQRQKYLDQLESIEEELSNFK
uniref:Uncharacterized protein n=1 Tax=Ciona savignyi TaxID=51511 RepID=H2ZB75_CIOSA